MTDLKKSGIEKKVKVGTERHLKNPFLDDLVITTKRQRVTISPMGRDAHVLVNQDSGEMQGTHVVTSKTVDSEEFVKLFSRNVALTFDLSSPGIKTFSVLIWVVQHRAIGKDQVMLDAYTLTEWQEVHTTKALSYATMKRGISELEKAKIIAKAARKGWYYINPSFVFSGNRIAFTTIIQRENDKKNQTQEEQLSLGELD